MNSGVLTFEGEGHLYKLDGLQIPSTTQIINAIFPNNFKFVPNDVLGYKCDLGTKVHTTTELYDKGSLDVNSLHLLLKSYLDSWVKFIEDSHFEFTEMEFVGFHPLYKYAYRIDRIGKIGKELTLIDIKTGVKSKTHKIQTAAYKIGYDYNKPKKEQIKKRMIVYISEKGYKIDTHTNDTDMNVFLSALSIFNFNKGK